MKKSTQELQDLMKSSYSSESYQAYLEQNADELLPAPKNLSRYLNELIENRKLNKAEIIRKANVDKTYGYAIFRGVKSRPSRDVILCLCIGMGLDDEEAQTLLKLTGYTQLYSRLLRDNIILFGLKQHMELIDINDLLYDKHLEVLGPDAE